MNIQKLGVSAVLAVCLAFLCGAAYAQTFYGTLVGSVQDSTGAVIPGASVTVTNLATGCTTSI